MTIPAQQISIVEADPSMATRPGAIGRFRENTLTLLRTWRERARSRRELALMDERVRNDIAALRDVDWRHEASKPFWRA